MPCQRNVTFRIELNFQVENWAWVLMNLQSVGVSLILAFLQDKKYLLQYLSLMFWIKNILLVVVWFLTLSLCALSPEDVLSKDAGECAICLEELQQGDTIARLPCLCIYHKGQVFLRMDVKFTRLRLWVTLLKGCLKKHLNLVAFLHLKITKKQQ